MGKQHVLEQYEKNYSQNQEAFKLRMLRNLQGLHAPLRLRTEMSLASKVGRLAPLESSNLMVEAITGLDETLDFQDILGDCEHPEVTQVACRERLLVKATDTV
jgi:proteasome maturation protein